jgi:BirA family transcriptional regulator, biotin operon repressor / biotin---[acetyl-CoA-carboxylase] ligase
MSWTIERHGELESTQETAQERAREGAPHGTVVIAARQSAGHGQHGRPWYSPEGGLYLSVVLRGLPDARLVTLALWNAVADALEVAGAEPQLKWVNDVLVGGRKIAGVIADAEFIGDAVDFVVAGIGVNTNGRAAGWPHPLNQIAVTLEDLLGADSCVEDLEELLLQNIEDWTERLRRGDRAGVLSAWRARDALVGKRIGFDPEGDLCAKFFGVADGIDGEGRLRIVTDEGVQAYATGTVFPHAEGKR